MPLDSCIFKQAGYRSSIFFLLPACASAVAYNRAIVTTCRPSVQHDRGLLRENLPRREG